MAKLKAPLRMVRVWTGFLASESQSDRHPKVLSIRVGEILLCLISINSPTHFARRGINFWSGFQRRLIQLNKNKNKIFFFGLTSDWKKRRTRVKLMSGSTVVYII